MKYLLTLTITTLLAVIFLVKTINATITANTEVPKQLLENTTRINGRIDIEFLEKTFAQPK